MARKKVYVSSTFKDLEEHRSAVKATLERAGFDVECMEKYPAFDERPKDKCLADVAECDYYVLILAWRYGFQPEDVNPRRLAITRLEYEAAVRLKNPALPSCSIPNTLGRRVASIPMHCPPARRSASSAGPSKPPTAGVSSPRLTASPPPCSNPCARKSTST